MHFLAARSRHCSVQLAKRARSSAIDCDLRQGDRAARRDVKHVSSSVADGSRERRKVWRRPFVHSRPVILELRRNEEQRAQDLGDNRRQL